MRGRKGQILGCVLLCCSFACSSSSAQSTGIERIPPTAIGPAERITLNQLQQAIRDGDAETAVQRYYDLVDQSGRLLTLFEATSDDRSAFLTYWPLSTHLPDRLLEWTGGEASVATRGARVDSSGADSDVLRAYRAIEDPLALDSIHLSITDRDIGLARRNAERYLATSHGATALQVFAELALERGWYETARAALLRLGRPWKIAGVDRSGARPPLGLPWDCFGSDGQMPGERVQILAARLRDPLPLRLPLSPILGSTDATQVTSRLIACSLLEGDMSRAEAEAEIAGAAPDRTGFQQPLKEPLFATFKAAPPETERADETRGAAPTFRFLWSTRLPTAPDRSDQADPAEVPVARAAQPPISLPAIAQDRLLVQTPTDVRGYSLTTGQPWPEIPEGRPFYDSGYDPSDIVFGSDVPVAGWPLLEPTVAGDLLFIRQGPEVTGWIPETVAHRASTSVQMVFDLRRDGALLDGYPLQPPSDDSYAWEWEGPPVVAADVAIASVTARTSAGMVNRLVAWDVATAAVRWKSPILALAPPLIQNAHITSTSIPSLRGDLLFHCSSLGSVSAINLEDGRIVWTTSYPRAELARDRHGVRRRAAFRHRVQPCVAGDTVVVAPRDCDRVFAVDAETGRLRWATAPGVAADALYLTRIAADRVLASGDALYWLDAVTGNVDAVFPHAPSITRRAALPSPRAVGAPAVGPDYLYWPSQESVIVFERVPESTPPAPVARLDLTATATPSGHVLLAGDRLVVVSGAQLTVFAVDPNASPTDAPATE